MTSGEFCDILNIQVGFYGFAALPGRLIELGSIGTMRFFGFCADFGSENENISAFIVFWLGEEVKFVKIETIYSVNNPPETDKI